MPRGRTTHNDRMSSAAEPNPFLPRSDADHRGEGRAHRQVVPRHTLAETRTTGRRPLAILAAQDATRVPELVPLRAQRMAASAFAFFRGTAALMAADLASAPSSGIPVASCGDAHVANFGFYASPQRTLVFDLNDYPIGLFPRDPLLPSVRAGRVTLA